MIGVEGPHRPSGPGSAMFSPAMFSPALAAAAALAVPAATPSPGGGAFAGSRAQ
jgi:hypothetical protein